MRSVGKHIYRYYMLQLVASAQTFLLLQKNSTKQQLSIAIDPKYHQAANGRILNIPLHDIGSPSLVHK